MPSVGSRSEPLPSTSNVERNIAINRAVWPQHEDDPWERYQTLVNEHSPARGLAVDVGSGRIDAQDAWFGDRTDAPCVVHTDELFVELHNNPGEAKVVTAAQALPFSEASVDVVLSRYAFEHMKDARAPLREIARVLKPGGALVFVTPNARSFFAIASRITPLWFHRWAHRKMGDASAEHLCPTYYRLNTPERVERACHPLGLRVETIEYLVGPPEPSRFLPTPIHKLVVRHHLAMERDMKLRSRFAPVLLGVIIKQARPRSSG